MILKYVGRIVTQNQKDKINQQIKSAKSQLGMGKNLKQELLKIAESITTNIHYPCNLGNINILFEYQFYFDICQIIFPNISIQLVKIREDNHLEPGKKMDYLVSLLKEETQYDISSIKGQQIIRGQNISHLYRFLQVLEKFSQLYQAQENEQDNSSSRRVRSDPNTSSRLQDQKKRPSMSARQNIKKQTISESEDEQEIPKASASVKKRKQKKVPSYSAAKKQMRTRSQTCKNLYSSLVNIMMTQKNRTMKASLRDNRKNRNEDIIAAKNKYKSYLINYAKQNRAQKNRQSILQKPQKQSRNQLPIEQFQNIQNFFKSFQLKLRDRKYGYLKRIQKLVRVQQIDRMCYLNKLEQQKNKQIKKLTKKEMQKIQNEHKIRSTLLKQEFQSQKQANKLMKKQYERYLRTQKKELKENKKRQLQKITDFMSQENGKVLISLQEGGRLQKVILDMYKRF